MTHQEYDQLKVGDVVLFNGRPRIVRGKNARFVTFAILHRSWTGRGCTVYIKQEILVRCELPDKDDGLAGLTPEQLRGAACQRETEAFEANGFDPLAECERELAEEQRISQFTHIENRAEIALLRATRRKLKGGT